MDTEEIVRLAKNNTLVCKSNEASPGSGTIALCIAAGSLFVGLLVFCLFIFCKYIILMQKGKQKSMVVFYSLCAIDISTRIAYFVISCFHVQTDSIIFYVSSFSSIISISAGVCHSHNLGSVILDLAALRKETQEEQVQVAKKAIYFRLLLCFWVCMFAWYITELSIYNISISTFVDFCAYFLLGVQLLTVNSILLSQMNGFAKQANVQNLLSKEKNFLICTLVFFAGSYLISTIKNIIMYILFNQPSQEAMPDWSYWFCTKNFHMALFNISFYLTTEGVPYFIIFTLNFKNYRRLDFQDREKQQRQLPVCERSNSIDTTPAEAIVFLRTSTISPPLLASQISPP